MQFNYNSRVIIVVSIDFIYVCLLRVINNIIKDKLGVF